ncbi:hypothetical protein NC652_004906 [Populus alba x Populus x berolinensis]|nr:hypothetical protein NC652_004906 [Populus alba x Populus x berolinensis]
MYASATCSTSHFLPQTAKRFDSVSFAAFRLRCPGCRNSVAFEFRVIALEHVCAATCSTSVFLPQTAKRFDSVSFAAFQLRCPGCRNSVAFEFRVIPLEHISSANAKRFDSVSFANSDFDAPVAEIQLPLNFGWSAIAARLPGRTDNEIKNVWHTHLKKRLEQHHVAPEIKGRSRCDQTTEHMDQFHHNNVQKVLSADNSSLTRDYRTISTEPLIQFPYSPLIIDMEQVQATNFKSYWWFKIVFPNPKGLRMRARPPLTEMSCTERHRWPWPVAVSQFARGEEVKPEKLKDRNGGCYQVRSKGDWRLVRRKIP